MYKSQLIIYQYIQRDECQPRWIDSNYVIVMKLNITQKWEKLITRAWSATETRENGKGKLMSILFHHLVPSDKNITSLQRAKKLVLETDREQRERVDSQRYFPDETRSGTRVRATEQAEFTPGLIRSAVNWRLLTNASPPSLASSSLPPSSPSAGRSQLPPPRW